MILPGLVSITFRKLSVTEIVDLTRQAKLKGIEWGGDVHVPHGDLDAAHLARRATTDAGLVIPSYGSYYRAGSDNSSDVPYQLVLDTAQALTAPVVRVWAGVKGSDAADAPYRASVVEDLRRIGDLSQAAGIRVACEFHNGTRTDSTASALQLMKEVDHPNVGMYWQPKPEYGVAYGVDGITSLSSCLVHLHVFHWTADGRRPLADGAAAWHQYLEAANTTGRDHWALLEFVLNADPAQFLMDASTLIEWLATWES